MVFNCIFSQKEKDSLLEGIPGDKSSNLLDEPFLKVKLNSFSIHS